MITLPKVGIISDISILNKVVLPAPLDPSITKHSPFFTFKETPFNASLVSVSSILNELP